MSEVRGAWGVWKCAHCGVEKRRTVHQARKTYCSMACMAEGYRTRMVGSDNPNYRAASLRECEKCGREFSSYQKERKYCSQACYHTSREKVRPPKQIKLRLVKPARLPKPKTEPLEKACLQCGTLFRYFPSNSSRKYCSYQCHLDSGGAFRAGLASSAATAQYGAKKDANHDEIFEVLRERCIVYDLSSVGGGCPDGIAGFGGEWHLFDVKNPKTGYGRRGLNEVQKKWLSQWQGGPVYLIYTVEEAEMFVRGEFDALKKGLSGAQEAANQESVA